MGLPPVGGWRGLPAVLGSAPADGPILALFPGHGAQSPQPFCNIKQCVTRAGPSLVCVLTVVARLCTHVMWRVIWQRFRPCPWHSCMSLCCRLGKEVCALASRRASCAAAIFRRLSSTFQCNKCKADNQEAIFRVPSCSAGGWCGRELSNWATINALFAIDTVQSIALKMSRRGDYRHPGRRQPQSSSRKKAGILASMRHPT